MNFKKFISGVSAFAIAASAFAGMAVTASAEEATLNAAAFAGFNTAETDAVYTETPVKMNQIDLNGNGGFKTISTFAFVKFDASAYANYTIGTATLTYDVTAGGYNSGMALGTVTNIPSDWTAAGLTVDTAKAYTGSSLFNSKTTGLVWSTKNTTKTIEYDVTDTIKTAIADNSGIVTFFVATTTAREQTLSTIPTLKVTYSEKEVAGAINVSYVDGDNNVLGAPATQPSVEGLFAGDTVTFAFPAYVKSGDDYYKATATGFNKTVDLTADAQDVTVEYAAADKVVDFAEVSVNNRVGHAAFADPAANINASAGVDGGTVYGQAGTGCKQTFTVPVKGNYDITVNAVGTSSKTRSVYLTVDTTDTTDKTPKLACANGSTATQTINVDLTAGEHTFYFMSDGAISPILDYMVVELVKEDIPAEISAVTQIELNDSLAAYTYGDGVWTKAFTFTVTPNDQTVTAVKVKASNNTEISKTVSLSGEGSIVFGVLAAAKTESSLDNISFTPSITVAE